MRHIALALVALAVPLSALADKAVDPARAQRIADALALAAQGPLLPQQIETVESEIAVARTEDPLLALALLDTLARHRALTENAVEQTCQIALSADLDPSLRRQAISTLDDVLIPIPEATLASLASDDVIGEMAQAVLLAPPSFANVVFEQPELRDGCTILVHGSFNSPTGSTWWQRDSGFVLHLDQWVGNVWRIVDDSGARVITLYPFSWPASRPTEGSLNAAGGLIASNLQDLLRNTPPPIDIIAHSHGGNVVIKALAQIAWSDPPPQVRNLILIATPHILDDGQLHHWPQDDTHPFYSCYERVINIQSSEDIVSGTLASLLARGSSSRSLTDFDVPRVTDLIIETDVGCIAAHRVLHSNEMANRLGRAMRGEIPWAPGSFPPITDSRDQGITP